MIRAAIEANLAGEGYRRVTLRVGVRADTVRGWLRRFAERADQITAHFRVARSGWIRTCGRCCGRGRAGRARGRRSDVCVAVRAGG
jgi:hypothetical protein